MVFKVPVPLESLHALEMENTGMFRELLERSDDPVIVTDQEFNISFVSSSAISVFGRPLQELLGRNVFELVPPDRISEWKQYLGQHPGSFTAEIYLTVAQGKKAYFDIHVSHLAGHEPAWQLAFYLHDITERKLREYELIRANQQLDQVIYKTTHDLKAPLMSALGLVNLAEKAPAEEHSLYIEMIRKSLLKLDSFIEEMNDFFRNEKLAVQRERIDIVEMLKEEIQYLHNLPQGSQVQVSFTVEGESAFYSDSIRVKTILTNILSNAIKYSDPKKIEPFIQIFVSLNQDFCQIRIVDNGIGIDSRFQDKIFDLFYRATTQSQGTGLGLFIVRDTIQKLKGTIEVSSVLGDGTTFLVRIPNQILQPIEVV